MGAVIQRRLYYLYIGVRWLLLAGIIGLVCGTIGLVFHAAIEGVTEIREAHPWVMYGLPLFGVVIVWLYHSCGMHHDRGTNQVLDYLNATQTLRGRLAPLIFVGTTLSHLGGGSCGREGAALQVGGSIGAYAGKLFHLSEANKRVLTMCGMSAVFSAMFGTPITAAIFSIEVVCIGQMEYSALVPCIISAAIAYWSLRAVGAEAMHFSLETIPAVGVKVCVQVVVLAFLCAIVSVAFCVAMHVIGKQYKRIKNHYIRVVVGGVLVIVLTRLVGNHLYNGTGVGLINQAMNGTVGWESWLLKIVFTAVTLGAGYKGGEIVPSLCIGACFGNVAGMLLGMDPTFAAALGMITVFCSVVNCPIASIMLSLELFGKTDILWFAIASAIGYVFSGYYGLYKSQTILYSKITQEYINVHAKG